MATNLIEIIIKTKDLASKTIKNTQSGLKNLGNTIKNVSLTAVLKLGASFAVLNKSLSSLIGLANKQTDAINKLTISMKNNNTYSDQGIENLKKFASELQGVTIYGDEAILEMQSLLTSLGNLDEKGLKKVTEGTLDFATKMGVDLNSSAQLIGKTLGSSTNALSRYGLEVTGAVGSTERLDSIVKAISDKFGGSARAETNTFSGAVKQLKNEWGDFLETLGFVITKNVNFIKGLTNIVKKLKDMNPFVKKTISYFLLLATALTGIATVITAISLTGLPALISGVVAAGIAFNAAFAGIPIIIAGISAGIVALGIVSNKFIKKIGGWKVVFLNIKKIGIDAFIKIQKKIIDLIYYSKLANLKIKGLFKNNSKDILKLEEERNENIAKLEEERANVNAQIEQEILRNKQNVEKNKTEIVKNAEKNKQNAIQNTALKEKQKNKETIEDYKKWKQETEAIRDVSLQEEINYLEKIKNNNKLNSEELKKIDEELYKAKKELRQKNLEEAKIVAKNLLDTAYDRQKKEKEITKDHKDSLDSINLNYLRKIEDINRAEYSSAEEKAKAIADAELEKNRSIEDLDRDTAKKRKEIQGNYLSDIGEALKKELKKRIDAIAAQYIAEATIWGLANALWTFGGSLATAAIQVAGIVAAATSAKAALDAITFHDGGNVGEKKGKLKHNEVNAILKKGEKVITQPETNSMLQAMSALNSKIDNLANNKNGLNVNMNSADLTVPIYLDSSLITKEVVKNYNKARRINTITKFVGD